MIIIAIIPARMGSPRFPGKPLAEICGTPMIGLVYQRTIQSHLVDQTYIADEVKPKEGRLVMFLNAANAYHSVSTMGASNKGRHFVYGAYTLSTGLGSLARKKSTTRLPTEFDLYRL